MKTYIEDGLLIVEVSNDTEEYAIKKWIDETIEVCGTEEDCLGIIIKRVKK
jgi:hypothetical protein